MEVAARCGAQEVRTNYEEGAEESRRTVFSNVEEDWPPDGGRYCKEIEAEVVPCALEAVECCSRYE